MTIVCISLLLTTFASDFSMKPLRDGAGYVVVPFQKGISKVGEWLESIGDNFRDVRALSEENKKLKAEVEDLKEKNSQLVLNQKELERLEQLYETDGNYTEYPKIHAKVIGKEPGNWYSIFTINKGEKDGISVDMNVLASGGLVGLVTEVGPTWSTVQTIINDSSNVSGMTVADSDTCIVSGSLEHIDDGKVRFSQLHDENGSVSIGENIVTSNISDKYLEGIMIGTISNIEQDTNNLTSNGYLVPAVDFRHLQDVLVITRLKENTETDDKTPDNSDAEDGADAE